MTHKATSKLLLAYSFKSSKRRGAGGQQLIGEINKNLTLNDFQYVERSC